MTLENQLQEHLDLFTALAPMIPAIERAAATICAGLANGNKVLLLGNGGSAADAQHIASELVGRYLRPRQGLPAIALTTDSSAITAISNDLGYAQVFARQLAALANTEDLVIAYSTSGNSTNVLVALDKARELGCIRIGLTGQSGGKMANRTDQLLAVPSSHTPRIQEAHAFIGHAICDLIDAHFAAN